MQTIIGQPVPELPVRDVEEAQVYYRDKLGFEITWTYPGKSIGAAARGTVSVFFRRSEAEIIPTVHWMYADDVDATYIELKNSGATIIDPIENKPWGMRQFTIQDLNGHVFYVHHDL